jgi:hypothetical protein
LTDEFNNLELTTEDYIYSYRVTQKGKVLSNKRKTKEVSLVPVSHNKKKNYILEDGTLVPALVDLSIQMPDGKVTKAEPISYLSLILSPALDTVLVSQQAFNKYL